MGVVKNAVDQKQKIKKMEGDLAKLRQKKLTAAAARQAMADKEKKRLSDLRKQNDLLVRPRTSCGRYSQANARRRSLLRDKEELKLAHGKLPPKNAAEHQESPAPRGSGSAARASSQRVSSQRVSSHRVSSQMPLRRLTSMEYLQDAKSSSSGKSKAWLDAATRIEAILPSLEDTKAPTPAPPIVDPMHVSSMELRRVLPNKKSFKLLQRRGALHGVDDFNESLTMNDNANPRAGAGSTNAVGWDTIVGTCNIKHVKISMGRSDIEATVTGQQIPANLQKDDQTGGISHSAARQHAVDAAAAAARRRGPMPDYQSRLRQLSPLLKRLPPRTSKQPAGGVLGAALNLRAEEKKCNFDILQQLDKSIDVNLSDASDSGNDGDTAVDLPDPLRGASAKAQRREAIEVCQGSAQTTISLVDLYVVLFHFILLLLIVQHFTPTQVLRKQRLFNEKDILFNRR